MENFRLGNTTITFSDDFEILNEFRQAVKAETDGISPGTDISKGIKEGRKPNVDRLAHGYTDYLNSIFTEELVPLAVNFLVHYDIYDCSEELFIRKYQEKYFLMDNRPEFKKFLQEYTAISDEYSQKKAYQKVYLQKAQVPIINITFQPPLIPTQSLLPNFIRHHPHCQKLSFVPTVERKSKEIQSSAASAAQK